MRYTPERLREITASPIQLWVELGIHKGFLGERAGPRVTRYYYLGLPDVIGVCHPEARMVLNVEHLAENWMMLTDPTKKYEGPAIPAKHEAAHNGQDPWLLALLTKLNDGGKPQGGKPRLNLRNRPPPKIDPEDNPARGRALLYHPESDCYFIETDPDEIDRALQNNAEDVTGIKQHEAEYARRKQPKRKLNLRRR